MFVLFRLVGIWWCSTNRLFRGILLIIFLCYDYLIGDGLISYSRIYVIYWDIFLNNFDVIIFKLDSGLKYYPRI